MAISKISQTINHINKRNSVLVVTGKQTAKIYELRQGRILQDPVIAIKNPTYTDNEGFNMRRGRGTVWGTPSGYDPKDNSAERDFLQSLKKETKELDQKKNFDAVYLFAPSECAERIRRSLPVEWRNRIEYECRGNYTKVDPPELLRKLTDIVEQDKAKKQIELKSEAAKLLRRKKIKKSEK